MASESAWKSPGVALYDHTMAEARKKTDENTLQELRAKRTSRFAPSVFAAAGMQRTEPTHAQVLERG